MDIRELFEDMFKQDGKYDAELFKHTVDSVHEIEVALAQIEDK